MFSFAVNKMSVPHNYGKTIIFNISILVVLFLKCFFLCVMQKGVRSIDYYETVPGFPSKVSKNKLYVMKNNLILSQSLQVSQGRVFLKLRNHHGTS